MHKILKDFIGSQNGTVNTQFNKGETVELSDYLVSCVNPSWVQKVEKEKPSKQQPIENKAIITSGKQKKRVK